MVRCKSSSNTPKSRTTGRRFDASDKAFVRCRRREDLYQLCQTVHFRVRCGTPLVLSLRSGCYHREVFASTYPSHEDPAIVFTMIGVSLIVLTDV
jgi:hypothetical protein